ncbi:hypothetical protein LTR56_017483 [Elasticomyces elasticus]|nr:hypothetical protein LTR56_017483 [Elasticomyces elasticus]KAK3640892.1 hypothetical protein LTR22_016817 [Elasticomyces elasticus]KAK4920305.1 hypothetical protein LTR49_012084 [Elasticomyces elasticus]KAK5759082.1 hypothetical protein LTS12_010857 [Elasticomyces elasticus]
MRALGHGFFLTMLQWLRQLADRRRDKSTVSTNVPPLTNVHNSHNRLLSLPDELLENVVSNLSYKIDLICLRQASRRMHYFLPVDQRECDLKHSERWDFRIALRRQAFLLASQAEAAGEVSKKKWPCHTCSDLHPSGKSPAWQQVKHITGRSCMLSQRRLEICEHHSFAVPQIMKIYENDMRHMYDRLKDWTVQGKVKEKGHHALLSEHQQCRHSIQIPGADCEVPSVRSLSITMRSPGEGGPAAMVCAQFKLDTFMRLTVLASELPAIPEPMITEYVSKIRELLSLIAVQLCPHTSTADRHVLDRFDEKCVSTLTFGARSMRDQPKDGLCRTRGCTMRFWFRREMMQESRSCWMDNLWLHVRHFALALPIAADHKKWLALTVDAGTVQPSLPTTSAKSS